MVFGVCMVFHIVLSLFLELRAKKKTLEPDYLFVHFQVFVFFLICIASSLVKKT